ncbi:hypothetical protein D3C74_441440 [compost metagenome]
MSLAIIKVLPHTVSNFIQIKWNLWHQNRFRSRSKTCMKSNIPCMTTHYLNDRRAFMGGHRVTQLVNRIYNNAYGSIKTNCIICE